jgi:hypothetical protein
MRSLTYAVDHVVPDYQTRFPGAIRSNMDSQNCAGEQFADVGNVKLKSLLSHFTSICACFVYVSRGD